MDLAVIDQLYTSIVSPDTKTYDGSQNRLEFKACLHYLLGRIQELPDDEIRFLEIGAFKGLWALALAAMCREAGKTPCYVTATWMEHNPANRDLLAVQRYCDDNGLFFKLVDGNSTAHDTIEQVLTSRQHYHIVLIDGDHSFAAVMQDIRHYAPLATDTLLFHDINTRECGVRRAIDKSRIHLNLEISYGPNMGIGIHDCVAKTPYQAGKKSFLPWR